MEVTTMSLASFLVKIGVDARDFNKGMDDAQRKMGNFASGLQRAAGFAAGLVIAGGVAQTIRDMTTEGILFNSTIEQSEVAFTSLLGTVKQSKQMVNDLYRFAAITPFEFPDLLQNTRKLMAFGFKENDLMPMLKSVGDAAAGLGITGQEGMGRIVIALGQMRTKARVMTQEMNQLTEAGIPAWEILAQAMGKSTREVMNLVGDGIVPADIAIQSLIKGMEERFPNMMEKQSKTMLGLFSTFKDYARQTLGAASKPGYDWIKDQLPSGIDMMRRLTEGFNLGGLNSALTMGFGEDSGRTVIKTIEAIQMSLMALKNTAQIIGAPIIAVAKFMVIHWNTVGPVIYTVVGAWVAYKTIVTAITVAQSLLNGTMAINPWIALAAVVLGVVTALVSYRRAADQVADASVERAASAAIEVAKGQELVAQYFQLKASASTTESAQEALRVAEEQLITTIPAATAVIDSQTLSLAAQRNTIEQLILTKNKQALESGKLAAESRLPGYGKDLESAKNKEAFLRDVVAGNKGAGYKYQYNRGGIPLAMWEGQKDTINKAKGDLAAAIQKTEEIKTQIANANTAIKAYDEFISGKTSANASAKAKAAAEATESRLLAEKEAAEKLMQDAKLTAAQELEAWKKALGEATGGKETDKFYDKLTSGAKDFTKALESQNEKFANFVGLFDKLDRKGTSSGQSLFNRLQKQVEAIKEWKDALGNIGGRVDSPLLMKSLTEMGPEYYKQIQGLSKLDDSKLKDYAKLYESKFTLSREAAFESVKMDHTGVIRVEGINDKGELVDIVELIADEIRAENDRYSNLPGAGRKLK
jgi:tape measure domain-containing protein